MQIKADPQCCFESGKVYTHAQGLSVAFRQHRATSHCKFVHGYSLQVEITFGCIALNENNWVQDFGDLKWIKEYLTDNFDHKLLVAEDDPQKSMFMVLHGAGVADVQLVPAVGIEAFAKEIFTYINEGIREAYHSGRVWVEKATVREHESNFATYRRLNSDLNSPRGPHR